VALFFGLIGVSFDDWFEFGDLPRYFTELF